MPITGFGLTKLHAEKIGKVSNDMKITPNISIKGIDKHEIQDNSGKPTLKITFLFSIEYGPDIANIQIEGNVLYSDTQEIIDRVIQSKVEGKVDETILNQALGVIQVNSHIKALELTREIGVPPHMGIPILQIKGDFSGNQKKESD